ncbi:hypothetical protein HDIA_0741 [Hartmannibacter diazotrophicus]|uniref:Uncharacterized protein n=1 Tax=Hartmannibacter diazotrophicus TaxID=1482074 RepID=A0A2C9D1T1_9HYPH|nr:hypothetical protein [Hartmannibacter diazotrophicus]SON54282.1 hypothetical protein HDIA_0741 [Hartmannibacter diazotrophicus]
MIFAPNIFLCQAIWQYRMTVLCASGMALVFVGAFSALHSSIQTGR